MYFRIFPSPNYLADYDANFAPYLVQSDGLGPYHNGNGVASILVANGYNWIVNGDWRLDLQGSIATTAPRSVAITFNVADTVKPGDPGYTYPANPPWWGTQNNSVRTENKCTLINRDMLKMHAGDKFTCPGLIRMAPIEYCCIFRRSFLNRRVAESAELSREVVLFLNSAFSLRLCTTIGEILAFSGWILHSKTVAAKWRGNSQRVVISCANRTLLA